MLLKQLLSIGSWQSQQLWLLLQEALVSQACKMGSSMQICVCWTEGFPRRRKQLFELGSL